MPIKIAINSSFKIDRSLMRRAAKAVLAEEGVTYADISLAFVDDKTSADVNKTYLNHAGPTDVITFPFSENAAKLEGELVIGFEVAQRVAGERGHSVNEELALYVIHGVLHLCGYDDKKKQARKVMRACEAKYLKLLKLPAIAERD